MHIIFLILSSIILYTKSDNSTDTTNGNKEKMRTVKSSQDEMKEEFLSYVRKYLEKKELMSDKSKLSNSSLAELFYDVITEENSAPVPKDMENATKIMQEMFLAEVFKRRKEVRGVDLMGVLEEIDVFNVVERAMEEDVRREEEERERRREEGNRKGGKKTIEKERKKMGVEDL